MADDVFVIWFVGVVDESSSIKSISSCCGEGASTCAIGKAFELVSAVGNKDGCAESTDGDGDGVFGKISIRLTGDEETSFVVITDGDNNKGELLGTN